MARSGRCWERATSASTRAAGTPFGIAVDGAGNAYVADELNDTMRKVTAARVVTTLAGVAGMAGSADGPIGRFSFPFGAAIDSAGNVYVADNGNHTIRKVTPGGVVSTLAGIAGTQGSVDGVGAAARFSFPRGVAIDGAGNIYVADAGNHTIRKVSPAGAVTTLAGAAGMPGAVDGVGAAARFDTPTGVAVDGAGNVYVTDNLRSTVRKITPTGVTTTLVGTPNVAGIRLGAAPRLAFPRGVAVVGDSLVLSDSNAILLLRHGAQ